MGSAAGQSDRDLFAQALAGYPDAARRLRERHQPNEAGSMCSECDERYPCRYVDIAQRAIDADLRATRVTTANVDGNTTDEAHEQKRPRPVQEHQTEALIPTTGVEVETQDKPIPAELAAESAAAEEPQPAAPQDQPSREDLVGLVHDLAEALERTADEMTGPRVDPETGVQRRDPVEVAAHLTIWARMAREHAGVR